MWLITHLYWWVERRSALQATGRTLPAEAAGPTPPLGGRAGQREQRVPTWEGEGNLNCPLPPLQRRVAFAAPSADTWDSRPRRGNGRAAVGPAALFPRPAVGRAGWGGPGAFGRTEAPPPFPARQPLYSRRADCSRPGGPAGRLRNREETYVLPPAVPIRPVSPTNSDWDVPDDFSTSIPETSGVDHGQATTRRTDGAAEEPTPLAAEVTATAEILSTTDDGKLESALAVLSAAQNEDAEFALALATLTRLVSQRERRAAAGHGEPRPSRLRPPRGDGHGRGCWTRPPTAAYSGTGARPRGPTPPLPPPPPPPSPQSVATITPPPVRLASTRRKIE